MTVRRSNLVSKRLIVFAFARSGLSGVRIGCFLIVSVGLFAQPPDNPDQQSPSAKLQHLIDSAPPSEFEVAEIKPCNISEPVPGCQTLHDLLGMSWAVSKDMIFGEPRWAKSDLFQVVAKVPEGAGKPSDSLEAAERYSQMLRKLLIDRFKIAYHFEDQMTPVYSLENRKKGTTLKESEGLGDDYRNCRNVTRAPEIRSYDCDHVPMQMLASWLTRQAADYIDRPVVDRTNLAGSYEIHLHWAVRRLADGLANGALSPAGDPDETLTIFEALKQQLGLALVPARFPEASVVIDRIERLQ